MAEVRQIEFSLFSLSAPPMGTDQGSSEEGPRKLTLREKQLEGLRRSAALANEPCPEVVQLEDEKNAAEEAERLRIKQEEEERTRLLAGSGSSKMSRFSELKSMGQAEAEQEKVSRNSWSLPASSVS